MTKQRRWAKTIVIFLTVTYTQYFLLKESPGERILNELKLLLISVSLVRNRKQIKTLIVSTQSLLGLKTCLRSSRLSFPCTCASSEFCKLMCFPGCKKAGQRDFSGKTHSKKIEMCHHYSSPDSIRNFTDGYARIFDVSFAFCGHVDII